MFSNPYFAVPHAVLRVLQQEGATFAPSCTPSRGLSADEASAILCDPVLSDSESSVCVEFREESVCFSVEFTAQELHVFPAECVERAMMVRRALMNMPSN